MIFFLSENQECFLGLAFLRLFIIITTLIEQVASLTDGTVYGSTW